VDTPTALDEQCLLPSPHLLQHELTRAMHAGQAASTSGAAPAPQRKPVARRIPATAAHPLAGLGGYAIPLSGAIGAARGVGAAGAPAAKRKREAAAGGGGGKPGKPPTKEEAAAQARREAARARVEQRTLKTFGLS